MREPANGIGLGWQLARRLFPLTLLIGFIVSLGLPAAYYLLESRAQRRTAEIYARELSERLQHLVFEAPALWKYQTQKYANILSDFLPYRDVTGIRVLDERGRPIVAYEHTAPRAGAWWNRNAPSGSAPILFNNRAVGSVRVQVAQGSLLSVTLGLLLLSVSLGVGLALLVYFYPLRVVQGMEGQIQGLVDAVERSNAELERKAAENAGLYEQAEAHAKKLTALSELTRLMTSSTDTREVYHAVARAASTLLGAKIARVWVADAGAGVLRSQGSHGVDPTLEPLMTDSAVIPYGHGLAGEVFESRAPAYVADVQEDPRWANRSLAKAARVHGYAGLPLNTGDRPLGVLSMLFGRRPPFAPEEQEVMRLLADQAAIAINNARLYEETERRRQEAETLLAVGQAVGSTLDLTEMLRRVAREAGRAVGADMVGAYLADPGREQVRPIAGYHVPEHLREAFRTFPIPLKGHRLLEEAFARRAPAFSSDVPADLRIDRQTVERFPHRSLLFVPMIVRGEPAGGLFLVWWERAYEATPGELRLVEGIGRQAATALENAQLYEEARRAYEELTRTQDQLAQSQKMEAVGRLAGGVAHDFNNLLTVIIGRSQMLIDRLHPEDPSRPTVDLVKKTADRAAQLTRQLLAFSRKQVLQPKVLDLNGVVERATLLLKRLIGEDIQLTFVPGVGLGQVKADPGQLEQVIVNLAVNARDAMPRGGRLTIETANVELSQEQARRDKDLRPGSYVMLAVSDTGIGMSQETKRRLFEPFFTTKEPGKGTGLGLATVYGIVKQSGGAVWVYSEPEAGATFKVYLPRVDEDAEVQKVVAEPAPPRGSETVLLAEDDDELRDLAREILETYGYRVLAAGTPAEALLIAEQHVGAIDLLLTDVVMPQMSGRRLVERLAAVLPAIRVLYMSGYTDDAIVHHGVLDPGTPFLQKPFMPEVLAGKVREVLDAPGGCTVGASGISS